jgi:hypothetical protein
MVDNINRLKWVGQRRRGFWPVDPLLMIFLLAGWSLIFIAATLGLRRDTERWLPVGLVSQSNADYRIIVADAPRLAPVNPQVIEAIRRDAWLAELSSSGSAVTTIEPTPTTTPVSTALSITAGGPYYGDEGSSIALAAESHNLALNLIPGSVTYRWDLDNEGRYDDAEGISASVVFYDEGEYTIGLQATDLLGRVVTDTTTVYVSNVPPLVNIGEDIEADEGQEIAFAATTNDPGHDLLSYEWDFGDGSSRTTGTLSPRHTYLDNSRYTVRLWVSDDDGGVTEDRLTVQVRNLYRLW